MKIRVLKIPRLASPQQNIVKSLYEPAGNETGKDTMSTKFRDDDGKCFFSDMSGCKALGRGLANIYRVFYASS